MALFDVRCAAERGQGNTALRGRCYVEWTSPSTQTCILADFVIGAQQFTIAWHFSRLIQSGIALLSRNSASYLLSRPCYDFT